MPQPQLGTAGAHLNSRPQKASTGSGRRRLPECDPATRMHLVCAERVVFNRYSSVGSATSAAASGPCSSRTAKPSSFRTGTLSCIALSYFDPGLSPTTTKDCLLRNRTGHFRSPALQCLFRSVAGVMFQGAGDDDREPFERAGSLVLAGALLLHADARGLPLAEDLLVPVHREPLLQGGGDGRARRPPRRPAPPPWPAGCARSSGTRGPGPRPRPGPRAGSTGR